MERQPEGYCDAAGYIPSGVGNAALKAANGGWVEIGGMRQGFLHQRDCFATQADSSPDRNLRRPADPHTGNRPRQRTF